MTTNLLFRCSPRLSLRLLCAVLALSLAGCAGMRAHREGAALMAEGKAEAGLAKLEEAVRLEPGNAEYRIGLATQRASAIQRLLAAAEGARREGRLSDAEKTYRQVQAIEPNHTMARQGLDAVVAERRHRQAITEAEALLKKGTPSALAEASDKLRSVLSENPSQREALNAKARVDDVRAKEAKAETRLAAAYRKPITLEFRDTPLKSVFDVIAKVSGLNFFFDKDLRPDLRASILVRNTSIEDAVRLLLTTNQLEQRVLSDNTILIYPNTPQKLKDYQTLSVRTFYLTNADVKAVSNTIKTIVKTKDLVIDERLGLIIMRDTPEAIRMAERIVTLQDLSDPEVMLEVEVLEIKRARLTELGVSWPNQLTLSPVQAGAPTLLSDLLNLNRDTIQVGIGNVTVNARKEDQDGNILTNPRIRVRNKDKARILIGDRVPVISTTSTSTGFVSESVNYVDVGLKLEVEPNIYLDDEVAIKLNLEVSTLLREIQSKSGTLAYQIGTRNASTVLRLRDGETQILAGLINDEDRNTSNKVPLIGQLPIVGRLFGSQKDDSQRSEILLSITPRVVRSIRRPDLMTAEFESGTEGSIGAAALRLTSVDAAPTPPEGRGAPVAGTPPGAAAASANAPAATAPSAAINPPVVAPSSVPAATDGSAPATDKRDAAAGSGAVSLNWQAPTQVKAGEQFSAVLRVTSSQALRGMPALLTFDPQLLQVVNVQEGDYFRQAKGSTNFSHRIDPAQGKVFLATVRQAAHGAEAGINGAGSLVTVTFKALKPSPSARLQLTSATPEPSPAAPVRLPVEQVVRIAQ
jgi:general secretion pathway protein D